MDRDNSNGNCPIVEDNNDSIKKKKKKIEIDKFKKNKKKEKNKKIRENLVSSKAESNLLPQGAKIEAASHRDHPSPVEIEQFYDNLKQFGNRKKPLASMDSFLEI